LFDLSPNISGLIKTLRNEFTGYIPVVELGVHPLIKEQILAKKIKKLSDDVEFWYKAGYDYIKLQPKADFNPAKIGVTENYSFNDDGTIFRKWASENKGVITNEQEFDEYKFPDRLDFDYSNFESVLQYLPDGMGVIGQYGDIFTMTWELMGFETFSINLFENEKLIENLNNKLGELVLDMFKNMSELESVDALWYSDDIAYTNGLLVSPDTLDKYFFPWLKKIGDLAKKNNKPLIYHSDGILFDVFEKIIECGVTAIHPIEPKAMNIEDVDKAYGKKLCLIGNIDVDLLSRGTENEIRKNVLENLEKISRYHGYCVGSGNSIPEYVNIDNYLTMIKTVKEFNKGL
jgi:uroporphyrinogen decarboxylase